MLQALAGGVPLSCAVISPGVCALLSLLVTLDGLGYKQATRGRAPSVVKSEMAWPSARWPLCCDQSWPLWP